MSELKKIQEYQEKIKELADQRKTLLVFAPHVDDEVLCAGGTIAKLVEQGWKAHMVYLTLSNQAFYKGENKTERAQRAHQEALLAARELGIGMEFLTFFTRVNSQKDSFEDMYLTPGGDLIRAMIYHMRRVKPSLVFTTWEGDFHVDHRNCGIAIKEAVYQSRQEVCGDLGEKLTTEPHVLLGEVDLENRTNMSKPDFWFDIGDTITKKVKALLCYDSLSKEHQLFSHKYLEEWCYIHARYRGQMCGCAYAEVFKWGNLTPPPLKLLLRTV